FGSTTKSLCIGRSAANTGQCYQGRITEVRVWNYARSQSDIQHDMYNRLTGSEEGLVGYWPLNEGSGTTVTNKVTNTSVPKNGGTWETDQLPEAFQQDNEKSSITKPKFALSFANTTSPSDYVIVKPFAKSPTHALTVEFWIKVSQDGRDRGTPLGISTPSKDNEFLIYSCKDIEIYVHNSAQKSSVAFKKDQWQHCAATWESKTGRAHLYIDGESMYSTSLAKGIVLDANGSLVLGQDQDSYGGGFDTKQAFQGQMAEVRVWDDVRTPEEINSLMNHRCTGTEEGLVGYWPLDEGEGDVAKDQTSNGHDGELHGVVWSTADELPLKPFPTGASKT
ncbi:MAG: hypothetical protein F6K09_28035, partial [Merismopedia sp. SIO2A8]|nr:hypothetical protein [Merismopedia sp. SIO2A8]